ncbi:MAG: OmpH family outer membrane protein [Bacteroidales bacterium]|jgi:outer membrane protein|nr:OmpH family outer membrane protein [Bacteroidales bacterium]
MKGTSLIVSIIVLFIAVAVLYVLYFASPRVSGSIVGEQSGNIETGGLKVAYIKADSIFLNYDLAQDLHDDFTQKQEAYMAEYSTKRQTFDREAAAFQEKVQRGGFLTEQRAVQERDRLLGREQEILQLDQDLTNRLAELQAANNQQLLDSLLNYIEILNAQKQYDYIFDAADILIGSDAHNFTAEVLAALNARYASKK